MPTKECSDPLLTGYQPQVQLLATDDLRVNTGSCGVTADRSARPIFFSGASSINDDVTELRDRDGGAGDNGTTDKDDLVQYVPGEEALSCSPSDIVCSR